MIDVATRGVNVRRLRCVLFAAILIVTLVVTLIRCDDTTQQVEEDNQQQTPKQRNVPKTFDFGAYVEKHKKNYGKLETLKRAQLFFGRTLNIFKFNVLYARKKRQYFLAQNQFTDATLEETRAQFSPANSLNNDLTPVGEASRVPADTPADELVDEHGEPTEHLGDSMSQASLSGHDDNDEDDAAAVKLNFFIQSNSSSSSNEQENENSAFPKLEQARELVRELANEQQVAKRMEQLIQVRDKRYAARGVTQAIPYKPIVESNNKNYDPSLIPSFGWRNNVELFSENFAKSLMDDFAHDSTPAAYPRPPQHIPAATPAVKTPPSSSSAMYLSVLDSIKYIYDDIFAGDFEIKSREDDATSKTDNDDNDNDDATVTEQPDDGKTGLVFDIDWRKTGCVSRPKMQANCNSCYAFATLDLLEFYYCRQKKTSTEFSVQYVIDCGSKANLNGCRGGKLSNVGVFVQKFGLQLNAAYPYTALEGACPFDTDDDQQHRSYALMPAITGWRMFPEISAWYKWLPKSPVIVGINMPGDFLAYGGGIHDGLDCTPGMVHAMLLVGSGKQDGTPFWLLKNNFADSWGEQGYFRLSKRAPIKCFNSAIVARANFHSVDATPTQQ